MRTILCYFQVFLLNFAPRNYDGPVFWGNSESYRETILLVLCYCNSAEPFSLPICYISLCIVICPPFFIIDCRDFLVGLLQS